MDGDPTGLGVQAGSAVATTAIGWAAAHWKQWRHEDKQAKQQEKRDAAAEAYAERLVKAEGEARLHAALLSQLTEEIRELRRELHKAVVDHAAGCSNFRARPP